MIWLYFTINLIILVSFKYYIWVHSMVDFTWIDENKQILLEQRRCTTARYFAEKCFISEWIGFWSFQCCIDTYAALIFIRSEASVFTIVESVLDTLISMNYEQPFSFNGTNSCSHVVVHCRWTSNEMLEFIFYFSSFFFFHFNISFVILFVRAYELDGSIYKG